MSSVLMDSEKCRDKAVLTQSQPWENLIALASQEVFELMVGGKLTPASGPAETQSGVTAVLGLAGSPCGVFSVRCPWEAASAIAAQMLGCEPHGLSGDEVCDALGEVCNMVAGSVKARLSDAGAGCMMSVPTVVRGADYEVRSLANDSTFSIVMEMNGQSVVFKLDLQA